MPRAVELTKEAVIIQQGERIRELEAELANYQNAYMKAEERVEYQVKKRIEAEKERDALKAERGDHVCGEGDDGNPSCEHAQRPRPGLCNCGLGGFSDHHAKIKRLKDRVAELEAICHTTLGRMAVNHIEVLAERDLRSSEHPEWKRLEEVAPESDIEAIRLWQKAREREREAKP